MKGIIFYFSGTGNTRYISNVIYKEFSSIGHDVSIHSIEEDINLFTDNYDFIVIGFPKYFEYTPIFLLDIIKNKIPTSPNHSQAILFCTESGPTKTSFYDIELILKEKNYTTVMTKSFRMPNNYYLKSYYKSSSEEDNLERINTSKIAAQSMVNQFLNKNYSIEKVGRFKTGLFRNLAFKNSQKLSSASNNFSIASTCNSCKLCEKSCPVQNITFADNTPKFNNNCVQCLRCINSCPKNAILYNNKALHQYKFPAEELINN